MRFVLGLALATTIVTGPITAPALDPAAGVLLIATEDLLDPNFAETVVLLLEHGPEEGAMGVVINRPTEIPAREAAAPAEHLEGRDDRLYHGGPVALTQLTVLVHARDGEPVASGREVVPEVVAVHDESALLRLLDGGVPEDQVRLYAGYAGWAPGQLEAEIARGGWYLLGGHARWVFAEEPAEVWAELIEILRQPLV